MSVCVLMGFIVFSFKVSSYMMRCVFPYWVFLWFSFMYRMCVCVCERGGFIHCFVYMCVCMCVCSYAALPGSAPNLCSPVPEGSLLRWLQPQLPLQEKHRPLLSSHFCWVDTARGVRKSPLPSQRAPCWGEDWRQKTEGLVVHDGSCEGVKMPR